MLHIDSATSRLIWLRRGDPSNPNPPGVWCDLALSVIGNAAARETFVTATSHMAAIWTDLFQSMITQDPEFRWRGEGPGIGRDARIAYSSLLGRYMARAYLTEHEGVRVLVPLDKAKRQLKETPYVIEKDPPGRGLEADWIGAPKLRRGGRPCKGSRQLLMAGKIRGIRERNGLENIKGVCGAGRPPTTSAYAA